MARCKYFHTPGYGSRALIIGTFLLLLASHQIQAFLFAQPPQVNCSHLCTCENRNIDLVMRHNRHKHVGLMGTNYQPDLQYGSNMEYTTFLGMFGSMLETMMEVKCQISDNQPHKLSSLLNGVDKIKHTALEVNCRNKETIEWDVASWNTQFNVFASDNCHLLPFDPIKGVVLPMNMWIFDVNKGGTELINTLDLTYTMNTVALSIFDSHSPSIPSRWQRKFLISAYFVAMQYTGLETFACRMIFTNRIDTLNLEHNEFLKFPECLLRSSEANVNYLSLSHNLISDLSPLYEGSDNTEEANINIINLSYNDIRGLEQFKALPNLRVLDLSHNFIRQISDDVFTKQDKLEQLYLSHNRIHTVGFTAFMKNIGLVKVDLSNNDLTSVFPEQLPSTSNILSMDYRNNKLTLPPFYECGIKNIPLGKTRFLSKGNPFMCDCNAIEFELCLNRQRESETNGSSLQNIYDDLNELTCSFPQEEKGLALAEIPFSKECIIEEDCPYNCECTLMNADTLRVNCSNRRLLEMPGTIPTFHNATVKVHLDHNPLQMLSHRDYLHFVSELHMDNCLISSVTPAAITALQNVRVLTLHNNLLQKLPSSTRNITLNRASNVTLYNNRWQCSCDSLWLPRWITKHRAVLWAPGSILCSYLQKPVEDFNDKDVNCNSSSSYLEVILATCLALASLVSTLSIVVYYRTEINVLIYSKLGLRLGSTLAYGDSFSPYDAFVSYSQDNYKWVVDTLVPTLEQGPERYRLCLHYRDFPSEEPVVENIPWAIHLSRCSILVLSNDFLRKEWCIMELRAAFQRLLLMSNKLIIITTDDVKMEDLSPDLRAYMNTHEYLRVGENSFWEKLEIMLPPKRQLESSRDVPSAIDQAGGDNSSHWISSESEHSEPGVDSELRCRGEVNLSADGKPVYNIGDM